ncbi:uncharacterized protein LOC132545249 [Ylistrum balloti]|uniref:uncharacterized protein LOC132545249 n=1 Tax=Ylistrum balloti TaxID=509963 RepID=UPI002905A407|nr:uncharacterized protein LOC132545249 [Ylistrum balloti]
MGFTTSFVVFAVTCLYTGTTGYSQQSLSELGFRRQSVGQICNSFRQLKQMLQRVILPQVDIFVARLFEQSPITREILHTESQEVCRNVAVAASTLTQNIPATTCFNNLEMMDSLNVYGGLCTRDGNMTAFFTNLTSNLEPVVMSSWTGACMENLIDIILTCPFLVVSRDKDLEEGSEMYRRLMQVSIQCVFQGIDANDMSMCGDQQSLKKVFLVIELLLDLAPGVDFTMTDFGL